MNDSETAIIKAIVSNKKLLSSCYDVGIPNCYTQHANEADLFFIRKSGYCDEVEIKVSRGDLMKDRLKRVRYRAFKFPDDCGDTNPHIKNKLEALRDGQLTCNYFWYAIKEGIGDESDIPPYAGLVIVKPNGRVVVVRKPKKLHANKLTFEQRYKMARKTSYWFWKAAYKINF